jgi:TfoX/Sxy family transcriptional regulator of competence genes
MSDAREALAERIRALLSSHGDVREATMFGTHAFMVTGRLVVAARRDGGLLVRTDPERLDDFVRRGAEQAQMGAGRPMGKGWLNVPPALVDDDGELTFWIDAGLDTGPKN